MVNKTVQVKAVSIFKRYLFFAFGLFVLAFGVALSTKADLGTSPISSVPYVLSLGLPLSMGGITFIMHSVFILFQIVILRKNYQLIQLLQLPVALIFGCFTDVTLLMVANVHPHTYLLKWVVILISCVIVAFGVSVEVTANVIMLAGEGLVSAIVKVIDKEFGKLKICFDTTLVICAAIFSFILFGKLCGVGEGTIAAAFLVGMIVKIFNKILKPFDQKYLRMPQ